MVMSIFFN